MTLRVALLILMVVCPALAHDLIIDAELAQPDVRLAASYGLGGPTAQATVSVFAPDNPETPLFAGLTDAGGGFTFTPSDEGDWLVVVDDGYGHREQRFVTVVWATAAPAQEPRPSLWSRAGAGLALIFGSTAFFMWGNKRTSPPQ